MASASTIMFAPARMCPCRLRAERQKAIPSRSKQRGEEHRTAVAGQERQRHGHGRDADDQHDADLHAEAERPARRGAEIGASGRGAGTACSAMVSPRERAARTTA